MHIKPKIDVKNLVRELAENKVSSLELLREALSNAKDHKANRVWIQISKGPRNEITVLLVDDGDGMNDDGLAAFWGVGSSVKTDLSIGYKGHGTKLYFLCDKLTVATRAKNDSEWRVMARSSPGDSPDNDILVEPLSMQSPIHTVLKKLDILGSSGTAILIEKLGFSDASNLLSRRDIESYCDWFTVVGDIRSGLFKDRLEFHRAVSTGGAAIEALRPHECQVRPIDVRLQINGEHQFYPIGQGPSAKDREFLQGWPNDVNAYRSLPGLLSYGHRFADQHEGTGAQFLRNDFTALRLTSPTDWANDEFGVVIRIEGQRRQRETYLEARWQNHPGVYKFEERFGLWLCKDYLPIKQSNELLRRALEDATRGKLRLELRSLRSWQVFVNSQAFLPTANRNDISNLAQKESRIVEILVDILERALKQKTFQDWIVRLSSAQQERRRDSEISAMAYRRQTVVDWINSKKKHDAIDPMAVENLTLLDSETSLAMREPTSEQELFYLYSLLSARYEMPIHILEYDATHGVDAVGLMRVANLINPKGVHGRIEFKFEVSGQNPIDHFFDAIDAIICWRVDRLGAIYEEGSASDTIGTLRRREKPILRPAFDTHEIAYTAREGERVIPVLQIRALFFPDSKPRARSK